MRALLALALLTGCSAQGTYECKTSAQCRDGSASGYCETSGFCSFEDASCPSQHRYDDSAGSLANACVDDVVTGRYHVLNATNNERYEPVVDDRPYAASAFTLTAKLDDGTTSPVEYRDDGSFSFHINHVGQSYRLVINNGPTEYQHDAAHLELAERTLGRSDRMTVPPMTILHFMNSAPNIGGNNAFVSTGLWTETITSNNPNNVDLDWRLASRLSGPSGLLEASRNDRLYWMRIQNMTGYSIYTSKLEGSITMSGGVTTTFSGALTGLLADRCVHVVAPLGDEYARLTTALPDPNYQQALSWDVNAASAPDQLSVVGLLRLAVSTGAITTNVDISPMLANPFPGTTLVAVMDAAAAYPLLAPGASIADVLYTRTSVWNKTGSEACPLANLAPTVAVADRPSLDGTKLDTDFQTVMIDRTRDVPLEWTHVVPGAASYSRVVLYQVTLGGALTRLVNPRVVVTTKTKVILDPEWLVAGSTYIVDISTIVGTPDAATGDFVTLKYPIEQQQTYSRAFTVQ